MPRKLGWKYVGLAVMTASAFTAGATNIAWAGTKGGLYDMKAMINEGHPFAALEFQPHRKIMA